MADSKPTGQLARLPSARSAEAERRRVERIAKETERIKKLRKAANELAATANGKIFLKHLASVCGRNRIKSAQRFEVHGENMVLVDVSPNATIHHAAVESVWLQVRSLLDPKHIHEMENLP